jgi:hypothetical protein
MVRSYAVTFFFVSDRFPWQKLFPFIHPYGAGGTVLTLFLLLLAILLPDIAFT